jgi:hypothetical protein
LCSDQFLTGIVSSGTCCAELVGIKAAAPTSSAACKSMDADFGDVERGYSDLVNAVSSSPCFRAC